MTKDSLKMLIICFTFPSIMLLFFGISAFLCLSKTVFVCLPVLPAVSLYLLVSVSLSGLTVCQFVFQLAILACAV